MVRDDLRTSLRPLHMHATDVPVHNQLVMGVLSATDRQKLVMQGSGRTRHSVLLGTAQHEPIHKGKHTARVTKY